MTAFDSNLATESAAACCSGVATIRTAGGQYYCGPLPDCGTNFLTVPYSTCRKTDGAEAKNCESGKQTRPTVDVGGGYCTPSTETRTCTGTKWCDCNDLGLGSFWSTCSASCGPDAKQTRPMTGRSDLLACKHVPGSGATYNRKCYKGLLSASVAGERDCVDCANHWSSTACSTAAHGCGVGTYTRHYKQGVLDLPGCIPNSKKYSCGSACVKCSAHLGNCTAWSKCGGAGCGKYGKTSYTCPPWSKYKSTLDSKGCVGFTETKSCWMGYCPKTCTGESSWSGCPSAGWCGDGARGGGSEHWTKTKSLLDKSNCTGSGTVMATRGCASCKCYGKNHYRGDGSGNKYCCNGAKKSWTSAYYCK